MKISKLILLVVLLAITSTVYSQIIVGTGNLKVGITNNNSGINIVSVKSGANELLNTNTSPSIFTLYIKNLSTNNLETIASTTGWGNIIVTNNGTNCLIEFNTPSNNNLPSSLVVRLSIDVNSNKSSWDLSVTGLGQTHSLDEVVFPQLNISAVGNDTFFYPLYSGQLTFDPANGIDYFDDLNDTHDNNDGIYPRGWGTTMQFFSYYNSSYGIYFGFHDPNASLKKFGIKDENGGIRIQCKTPASDKTIAANSWNMPGHFELDIYNGDWYDAALIYKQWVSTSADYWPVTTPNHTARQQSAGRIGLWLSSYISDGTVPQVQGYIQTALNFFDFPVGVHIYNWNNYPYDHFYPNYFPAKAGLDTLVNTIQNNNDAVIMPYINGRMWDTGIGGNDSGDVSAANYFNNSGFASACKKEDGSIYSMIFSNNKFATMCPTQNDWQDLLTDVANTLTNPKKIGAKSIYIDMIAASAPSQCMDTSHQHTLGGGAFWREGYKQMLQKMHDTLAVNTFITAEGGCDFIADQVDAFMVQGWTTRNQVPAWQAIYTGKVQLFGTRTGASMYGDQRFYGRLSQGFIYGVQTGRQFIWLAINPTQTADKLMAANYVKTLGRFRYKLRDFMSFGEMRRPIKPSGTIPDITYTVMDWGGCRGLDTLTNSAIRNSVWQNDTVVMVVFANARIQSPAGTQGGNINFTFSFDAADYGLQAPLTIQRITPTLDDTIKLLNNSTFQKSVSLPNLDLVAYKISGYKLGTGIDNAKQGGISIYPNPTHDYFMISHNSKIKSIDIYNSVGQNVLSTNYKSNKVDISELARGVYIVVIKDKHKSYISKLVKK